VYYNADCPYCLYSPQHVARVANDNYPKRRGTYAIAYDDCMELIWDQRRQTRTVPINEDHKIFIMKAYHNDNKFEKFNTEFDNICNYNAMMATPNLTALATHIIPDDDSVSDSVKDNNENDESPITITTTKEDVPTITSELQTYHPDIPDTVFDPSTNDTTDQIHMIPIEDEEIQAQTPQALMLAWHYRLNHVSFARIKEMAKQGALPIKLATCEVPKCAACLYGKATRRAWRSKAPINQIGTPPATAPGAVVSVDQMVSAVPGLIAQMRGFITRKRYSVATVYVDHFSSLSYVHLQQGATATETVIGKRAFERYAKAHGVTIKHYHADNGIFESREFMEALEQDGQTITFCGVNAHHQNGRAEKKIRDLQEATRTMIIHAQQRWRDAITPNLWPMAIKVANDIGNRAPAIGTGISPLERFSQVEVAPKLKHSHTFGAPVYVLHNTLQTPGVGIPKWDRRSEVGIYVGTSPRHSRKIALVLNLTTGHVSPQFHVKIDDFFETLRESAGNIIPKSKWQTITGLRDTKTLETRKTRARQVEAHIPAIEQGLWIGDEDYCVPIETEGNSNINSEIIEATEEQTSSNENVIPVVDKLVTTRSGRVSKPTQRYFESKQQETEVDAFFVEWGVYHDNEYIIQEELENPIAMVASSNPDVMYYDQAMKEDDAENFEQAMIDEVDTHTKNGHWEVVKRSQVPVGIRVLQSVWAMRRKRRLATGLVYKWKARLNVHGGQQEFGVNFWETYAPVISWNTIRMYLILAILNKRITRQIDWVLAYPQADIECDLYMEIPRGFKFNGSHKDHVLLLKKNLYGQKQAGRVWNQYLHSGLLARGFLQSQVDMCLYYHPKYDVNLLIYTDDGILIGNNNEDIDKIIDLLQQQVKEHRPFKITDEGTLNDYLGVQVEHMTDGTIKLSQPHLIQQIIDDIGFNERTTSKPTPAASTVRLHRDLHGEERREKWHYRSIIGKLNFLEKSTRPDIAYAVHQCARFSNDPKMSHENAIKRIVKFLVGTKQDGIYLRPDKHSFDCWVDADFVGNYNKINAEVDPSTAKSRTGYIINYGGCPISWASKLQMEVALSTTEAEYNALSNSLREVIFLMNLLEEAKETGWHTYQENPNVHCKTFEDNIGALEMARLPKMRPRTKHLCNRLHHFREHVRKGIITIHHIETTKQIADLLTKPQPTELFQQQRKVLMKFPEEQSNALVSTHPRACGILPEVRKDTIHSEVNSELDKLTPTVSPTNSKDTHDKINNEAISKTLSIKAKSEEGIIGMVMKSNAHDNQITESDTSYNIELNSDRKERDNSDTTINEWTKVTSKNTKSKMK
jgi:hypothetical protein